MTEIVVNNKVHGEFKVILDKHIASKYRDKLLINAKWSKRDKEGNKIYKYYIRIKGDNKDLHRVLTNAPKGTEVDHINGNTLDNRLCNLRVCSKAENNRNKPHQSNNTSGHMGVSFKKDKRKWKAYISVNKKQLHLGYFSTKEEAIQVRRQAEIKYFKEFAPNRNEV